MYNLAQQNNNWQLQLSIKDSFYETELPNKGEIVQHAYLWYVLHTPFSF